MQTPSRSKSPSEIDWIDLPENRSAFCAISQLINAVLGTGEPCDAPLFLHGGPGTGKSHLVQIVAETIAIHSRDAIVEIWEASELRRSLWRTPFSETIPEESIPENDLNNNPANDLDRLSEASIWIVENLQHFTDDVSDRFAHQIDALLSQSQKILLTATYGPGELLLSTRLRSRLASGIVVQIEPLSSQSRYQLAEQLCQRKNLNVQTEVIQWLSQQMGTGVRPIIGAIQRLESLRSLTPESISLDLLQKNEIKLSDSPDNPLERIAKKVSEHCAISIKALRGKARQQSILWPRQMSMYLARELTKLSFGQIGQYFGNRDHTTVLHAYQKVRKILNQDSGIARDVRKLQIELQNQLGVTTIEE